MSESVGVGVEELEWDSRFFGFKVMRLDIPESSSEDEIRRAVRQMDGKLAYLFVPVADSGLSDPAFGRLLSLLGATRQDRKTVYRKKLVPEGRGEPPPVGRLTPAIYELAYASGCCSRFFRDARLAPFFKKMYSLWLERDFREGAVLTRTDGAHPSGVATVSIDGPVAHVGLVAVDASCRGRGIGGQLMADIEAYVRNRDAETVEVVTQGDNVPARRLYERCGYQMISQVDIWHYWSDGR